MISQISIVDIDLFDTRYQIFDSISNPDFLSQSVKLTGLVNPVLLRPVTDRKNQKAYQIISGFNRIHACEANQIETVPAVITNPDISDANCWKMAISCVAFKRPISQTEMIICISMLSDFMSAREITDQSTALFNTRLNEKFVSALLEISRLPDPALELIRKNQLTLKTAGMLTRLDREDINSFLNLYSIIKATATVQLELLTSLKEISKRDNLTIETLISTDTVQQILADEKLDNASKTRQIRTWIYQMRYPVLSKAQEAAKQKIKNLNLGSDIKIQIPQTFEDQMIRFSFTADSPEKAQKMIKNLELLSNRGDDFIGIFTS